MIKDYENLEWLSVNDLILHPDNPKVHEDDQIEDIAESIEKLGWGRPLIISKDNVILAGNGTFKAATEVLHREVVPTVRMQWNHDEPEAISYMLADNKIPEMAEWDFPQLELNFENLKLKHFDLKLTGFKEEDRLFINDSDASDYNDEDAPTEFPGIDEDDMDIDFVCPKCGYEWSGKPK